MIIKKGFLLLTALMLIFPLISAEILVNNQPKQVYNIGDSASISMTVKSLSGATNIFYMNLICDGQEVNFYKNGISLSAGGEKKVDASLILTKELLGEVKGGCVVKGIFGQEFALTNQFTLSDKINITLESGQTFFTPGISSTIRGNAIKENGNQVNGFVDLKVVSDGTESIVKTGTVKNGFFSVDIDFPETIKSGKHLLTVEVYEKNSNDEKTSIGFLNQNIDINQVAKNLELILGEEAEPGKNMIVEIILHDQTGEKIYSLAEVTIKDGKGAVREQSEKATDAPIEIPIAYNEKPAIWKIFVEYSGLQAESSFSISEKKEINISIINNTVLVSNIGNVPYEGTAKVKIGEEEIPMEVSLDVDESQTYTLTAPDGKYEISIIGEDGSKITGNSFLTGRTVSVKEKGKGGGFAFSLAWLFVLLILGFVAYMLFGKSNRKSFFGYMPGMLKKKESPLPVQEKPVSLQQSSSLISRNPAVLSLSIKGEKQKATAVCLNIKNLDEIKETKGSAIETIQKVINLAEDQKAITYENHEQLFFILAPIKTRTFQSESPALKIAQSIKKILYDNNRMFSQKINFGISINNGFIIAKSEGNITEFISLGSFITSAKKMASSSNEEILLSREVMDKVRAEVKAERFQNQEDVYQLNEIKKNNEENSKFINNFVRRQQESGKKEKN